MKEAKAKATPEGPVTALFSRNPDDPEVVLAVLRGSLCTDCDR